jgi:hypothetical protein
MAVQATKVQPQTAIRTKSCTGIASEFNTTGIYGPAFAVEHLLLSNPSCDGPPALRFAHHNDLLAASPEEVHAEPSTNLLATRSFDAHRQTNSSSI